MGTHDIERDQVLIGMQAVVQVETKIWFGLKLSASDVIVASVMTCCNEVIRDLVQIRELNYGRNGILLLI